MFLLLKRMNWMHWKKKQKSKAREERVRKEKRLQNLLYYSFTLSTFDGISFWGGLKCINQLQFEEKRKKKEKRIQNLWWQGWMMVPRIERKCRKERKQQRDVKRIETWVVPFKWIQFGWIQHVENSKKLHSNCCQIFVGFRCISSHEQINFSTLLLFFSWIWNFVKIYWSS